MDASQQSTSGRQLIDAADVSGRYINFENLIQGKGTYQYEGDFSEDFQRVILRGGVFVARESSPAVFNTLEL